MSQATTNESKTNWCLTYDLVVKTYRVIKGTKHQFQSFSEQCGCRLTIICVAGFVAELLIVQKKTDRDLMPYSKLPTPDI